MPTCAYTYITKPEQSKPDGDAPPQTYGTPKYCIAIPTTPPVCEGGGAPAGGGAWMLTVCEIELDVLLCCSAASASRLSWAWRAASSACSRVISLWIEDRSARRWPSWLWMDAFAAARCPTTCTCSECACSSSRCRRCTSRLSSITCLRTIESCDETRSTASMLLSMSSRLDEPSSTTSVESWFCEV